jgi:enterochelin esterase family protein
VSGPPSEPQVTDRSILFSLPDPGESLAGVTLYQEISRPRLAPAFARRNGSWEAELPRPDADRVEYLLELRRHDDGAELVPDPVNPRRVRGPFGDRSVIELPGYASPAWVGWDEPLRGRLEPVELQSRILRATLPALVWTSAGGRPGEELPLLVANDGPEYAELSGLLTFLDRLERRGRLPAMRAALIGPVERDEIYSASAYFARALAQELLPALDPLAPAPRGLRFRVGMGASLGALAMLHAHRRHPALFGALYLQSGSYFRPRSDRQESGFPRFQRISRFVGEVLAGRPFHAPVPVTMTCGSIEENLANNRGMRGALGGQGYPVRFVVNRDGHTWTGWRDTFDPYLADLLAESFRAA